MSKNVYRYVGLGAFYAGLLLLWQLSVQLEFVPDYVFPSPLQVVDRMLALMNDGLFWPSLMATLLRMIQGFAVAVVFGILLGLGMGMNRWINSCLKSLFLGLLTLPTAAWAPIALIIFGLSDRAIYFVIFMSAMPAMSISTSEAILHIPPIYYRAAQTLGTPGYMMPWRVIIPAALPQILTGIKLGWTLGWHGAVSAELIKSSVGLGFLLHMGREMNDAAQVIGIMLVTIVVGILLDRLIFLPLEKSMRRKRGVEKKAAE